MDRHTQFEVHMLNPSGIEKAKQIRDAFDNLLTELDALTPNGGHREMAIVRTKLEEACFFAKKALANQPENQQ